MAGLKKKNVEKNTLQQVIEQEKQKIPSKYDYNKVLFAWEANDRPAYSFTGGQKSLFTAFLVFLGFYFFWVGQPVLTLVTAAIFFILFVFITVPPQRAKHSIETLGIRSLDYLYVWEDLVQFWVAEKEGIIIMYVDTRLRFPGRLIFMIESFQEAVKVVQQVYEKLPYKYLSEPQGNLEKTMEGKYVLPDLFLEVSTMQAKQAKKLEETQK